MRARGRIVWMVLAGLLAGCANPAAPVAELDCENARRPCDQLLPEIDDRLDTPFLADPATVVIGDRVVQRR